MKKMMKKVIVLTLVCAMLISNFTACGKKEETGLFFPPDVCYNMSMEE